MVPTIRVILQIKLELNYKDVAEYLASEKARVLRSVTLPLFDDHDGDHYDDITICFYREMELPYVPGKGDVLHFILNPSEPPQEGFRYHAAFSVETVEWLDHRKQVLIELVPDGIGDPVIPFNFQSTEWQEIASGGDYLSDIAFKKE